MRKFFNQSSQIFSAARIVEKFFHLIVFILINNLNIRLFFFILIGAKIAINISKTNAYKQFDSRLHRIPLPNCKHLEFGSDKYWECHIRTMPFTVYHPVGTCKMGPAWDPEAVVDPRLRIYGVSGLRVIDASIMPTIPSGNTNAPAIMVGEKGADLVKQDWLGGKVY